MSAIRPLERRDLPQVADLYEYVMGSGSRTPRPGLGACLGRLLLDHPWADPDIPSLVYETSEGRIVGFLGSHVRRLRVDGKPIRAGVTGQFMSDPAMRGVGALLLRRYFAGPQDVTLTDSAKPEIRPIWEGLGGTTASLGSLTWIRVFRPFQLGSDLLLASHRRMKRLARPLCAAFDRAAARVGGRLLGVDEPATVARELTPQAVLEHLPTVTRRARVRPDYDEAFLTWIFQEMGRPDGEGDLVRHLVCDQSGRVLGWYVAYLRAGGTGEVQQIAAACRDVEAVVEHLFYQAQRSGAAALRGQLVPLVAEPVWRRRCLLLTTSRFLVHARDPSLLHAIAGGDGLLSRMDCEWWMRHPIASLQTSRG
ncbi:MAG: hypothetical protein ACRD0K_19270 [Egibacteraceae bacterium]